MNRRTRHALFALALGACGPELNPPRRPPAADDLGGRTTGHRTGRLSCGHR